MKNIYHKLKVDKAPFFVLAPMDDVTDTVFRQIVKRHAPADLMVTEFANADGWCSPGQHAIARKTQFTKVEQPLIAQIWGITPANYAQMASDLVEQGYCGIDINMGCPVKDMIKRGACSALINNQLLASEIITAVQKAVAGRAAVSVKTRIGFDTVQTEEWLGFLLAQNLDAITVHGRTKKDMSRVPADWAEIAKVVKMRDELSPSTVIVGNGDVLSRADGMAKAKQSGVDGVMIGRGIFANFFVFLEQEKPQSLEVMKNILIEHTQLHEATWQGQYFEPLKKFVKMYINGFANASQMRQSLMSTSTHQELLEAVAKL